MRKLRKAIVATVLSVGLAVGAVGVAAPAAFAGSRNTIPSGN